MSNLNDITNEKRSATKGAVCGIDSENHPAQGLACDNQFGPNDPDLIHHHNEGKKARQQKQPEPDTEPDYESEGMVPHN